MRMFSELAFEELVALLVAFSQTRFFDVLVTEHDDAGTYC